MYAKSEAISHGTGTCMHCGRAVERILVGDKRNGGHREWRVVDWHKPRDCWIPHVCPRTPDPAPVRKAA